MRFHLEKNAMKNNLLSNSHRRENNIMECRILENIYFHCSNNVLKAKMEFGDWGDFNWQVRKMGEDEMGGRDQRSTTVHSTQGWDLVTLIGWCGWGISKLAHVGNSVWGKGDQRSTSTFITFHTWLKGIFLENDKWRFSPDRAWNLFSPFSDLCVHSHRMDSGYSRTVEGSESAGKIVTRHGNHSVSNPRSKIKYQVDLRYIIIGILFVRAVTLDGADLGIKYYLLEPDFSRILKIEVCLLLQWTEVAWNQDSGPAIIQWSVERGLLLITVVSQYLIVQTWRAALTQACFSLSIGIGGMLSLASYNKRSHPCYRVSYYLQTKHYRILNPSSIAHIKEHKLGVSLEEFLCGRLEVADQYQRQYWFLP